MTAVRVGTSKDFDACLAIFAKREQDWRISCFKSPLGSLLLTNSVYVAIDDEDGKVIRFLSCDYNSFTETVYLRTIYVKENASGAGVRPRGPPRPTRHDQAGEPLAARNSLINLR
jgi:hypothetical protein